jgi:hypothetical protein
MSFSESQTKPALWRPEYIVENLPTWIYTDNQEPAGLPECKAKISSLQYTIQDIELQIQIRELELKTGSSRHTSAFDYDKWRTQALRAKQTHLYLLNAYSYWLILNQREKSEESPKLNTVIKLLIDEPKDFVAQLEKLL